MRPRLRAKGTAKMRSGFFGLAALPLSSCADNRRAGGHIADMPHWLGGAAGRCTGARRLAGIRCMDGQASPRSSEAEDRAAAAEVGSPLAVRLHPKDKA